MKSKLLKFKFCIQSLIFDFEGKRFCLKAAQLWRFVTQHLGTRARGFFSQETFQAFFGTTFPNYYVCLKSKMNNLKIKVISRNPDHYQRETKNDIFKGKI